MKQYIQKIMISIGVFVAVALPVAVPSLAHAAPVDPFGACQGVQNSAICKANQPSQSGVFVILRNVINILLTIIGIVAVIMIIVGGLKYVTSAGDSNGVNGAKNTILYAVVGLVIAIMSFALVNFVLIRL